MGLSPLDICPPGRKGRSWAENCPLCLCRPGRRGVWLEVEPEGMLKEGDRVEIRCLADGNPQPTWHHQAVRALCSGWAGMQEWLEVALITPSSSPEPQHQEMEEERTDDT